MGAAGPAAPDRNAKRWWSFVERLANDDLQGRGTGSPAHCKAADLVAAEFRRAGLVPGTDGGHIQPVKLTGRRIVETETSLDPRAAPLPRLVSGWNVRSSWSRQAQVVSSPFRTRVPTMSRGRDRR